MPGSPHLGRTLRGVTTVRQVPLLMIDLDNTLVDRAAAFLAWAESLRRDHVPDDEGAVAWLVEADADGYTPRDRLAQTARDRFRLPRTHTPA